jgi:fructosamine-3-kinase
MRDLRKSFSDLLQTNLREKIEVKNIRVLSGGCINQAFQLVTDKGLYFLKMNKERGTEMFEAESKGLKLLSQTKVIAVPDVIGFGSTEDFSFLILSYVKTGSRSKKYWEDFGQSLAHLHKVYNDYFGLDHNNFIGFLPQYNDPGNDWIDFFINNRLEVQVKLAAETGRISKEISGKFEKLYQKLNHILVKEKPSLLHGDLWSGNVMTNEEGKASIIDPAVYFGNREAELAFTTLFGGFENSFYGSYQEEFPLEPDYEDRFDIYNLYPLMVHVNLFGGGYVASVDSVLRRYV